MSEKHSSNPPSQAPSEVGDASYDSDDDDRKVIYRGRYDNGYSDKIPELKKPKRGERPKFDPYTLQLSSTAPANVAEELTRTFHKKVLSTAVPNPLAMFPAKGGILMGAFFPATKERKPRALTEIGRLVFISLHFTSHHFISLHITSLHFTSLHFTSLHFSFDS